MNFKQRISYLIRSGINIRQEKVCPFCKNKKFKVIDRKYLVTTLLKCMKCGLNHRHPKDKVGWLKKFYQVEYSVETHMMTKLPSDDEVIKLKQTNFPTLRSYDKYIEALFTAPIKIIDFGCSWGYNVYKLIQSGYDALGYELSIPRTEFGKNKLGVPIFSDIKQLPENCDLILSSHVIEHLSDIGEFIEFSKNHLNESGVFMAFCPNGNVEYRRREPNIWHVNWGLLHPNYLDIEFAKYMFVNNPYILLTDDWSFDPNLILSWDGISQVVGTKLDGKELLIIAKPNIQIN